MPAPKESFLAGGSDEILRQAAIDVVGAEWRIDAIIDPSAQPDAGRPVVKQSSTAPPEPAAPAADAPTSPPAWASDDAPPAAPGLAPDVGERRRTAAEAARVDRPQRARARR